MIDDDEDRIIGEVWICKGNWTDENPHPDGDCPQCHMIMYIEKGEKVWVS